MIAAGFISTQGGGCNPLNPMKANIPKSSAQAALNISRHIKVILCGIITLGCVSAARGQGFETPPPEIVSAWKLNAENLVVVFRHDGNFFLVDGEAAHPGVERGSFEWDKETGAFSVDVDVDTNGDAGFSHPGAATSISIAGNTLNYIVPGEGSFPFTRIVSTASAIVGSWAIPGEKFAVTFLADGTYYLAEETNDIPFGYTGIEKGNYTWNSSTKSFTATAAIDTNGDVGVNGITLGDGITVNITGNKLVFDDGAEVTDLYRVLTNPTPIRLPDFGAGRLADFVQTSNSAPAPLPFNELNEDAPYTAEAFVEQPVGATAPTIRIGSGTPIVLEEYDPGAGEFDIEQGFPSLAELNSFLPFSSAMQFKDGTGTANLTSAPSPGTFPTTPKILLRAGDTWNSGVYRFGENEVLEWTLPAGFTASEYVTRIEVSNSNTGDDVFVAKLQGEVTFVDLAGRLESGKTYDVEISFYRIGSSTTAGTGVFAGKQGMAFSASITTLKVKSPVAAGAPSIFEQPVSQAGTPGSPLLLTVGINEGAFRTATFRWFKDNQEIVGQTGNCLFIPGFDPDEHAGVYRVVVTNSANVAESEPAIVGSPYAAWRSGFFTPAQLADPAVSGDDADFDNDGIETLLEFILGASPIVPDPNRLKDATSTPTAGGRNLVFSYDRKTVANGISQVIETSSTLTGTWTPAVHGVNGVVITTATLDANTQRVIATIPSTKTMLFVRINATR